MNTLIKVTAMSAMAAAALFIAQPSQAITAAMQPHSIIVDVAKGGSLVTTVARRGVAYREEPATEGAASIEVVGSIEAAFIDAVFTGAVFTGAVSTAGMGNLADMHPILHAGRGIMAVSIAAE